MNINIDQLCQDIESGIVSLAKTSLQDYLAAAKADGETLVNDLKTDIQQWAADVEQGFLKANDVAFLLKEQESLTEMTALKQAGLAAVRIDEFKTGVLNIITGALVGMVKV